MKIITEGRKLRKYKWTGKHKCAKCSCVFELEDSDASQVVVTYEKKEVPWDYSNYDQREMSYTGNVTVYKYMCPSCENYVIVGRDQ